MADNAAQRALRTMDLVPYILEHPGVSTEDLAVKFSVTQKQIEQFDKVSDFYYDFYLKLEKIWFDYEKDRITEEEVLEISYPAGYSIEAMPNTTEIENEFGYYKIEFLSKESNLIICKRKYILKQGFYEKEKYESFRKFKETISRTDNSKIILNKL